MKLFARRITLFFINKGSIDEDDKETYEYCFEMLFSSVFNLLILIAGALITKRYYETLTFAISFVILRSFIGGFHSKTHLGCLGLLVAVYIMVLLFLEYLGNYNYLYISFTVASMILIILFAPIGHPNNPLDSNQLIYMKSKAIIVSIVYCLVICTTFTIWPMLNIFKVVSLTMICSSVSMVIGYLVYKNKLETISSIY